MTLQTGRTLGHYEILSTLGAGGMGEVYRARDTRLGREVAIKILLEEVANDPERLARFDREARVLASLNHPHIATLHGFESDGATKFLVMELVEGETLADRIARGPIPVAEAIALFVQIAEGLEAAHEKGVIHRDLKPANVKISSGESSGGDRVKILDFGLAKALDPHEQGSSTRSPTLSVSPTLTLAATVQGVILGTAAYMAPEQARGRAVDKRADIWAFGVCLWEALAGKRLFAGEDASVTLAAVLKDEPDWRAVSGSIPWRLEELLRRCLERDPRQRLRDIGDARIALQRIAADPADGITGPTSGAPRRSRLRVLAAVVASGAALALAGVIGWQLAKGDRAGERPVRRYTIDLPSAQGRTLLSADDGLLSASPDGASLVYTLGLYPQSSLHRRDLDRLEGAKIAGTDGVWWRFHSPDGQWIGFYSLSEGEIRKIPRAGGTSTVLVRTKDLWGATWTDRAEVVYVPSSSEGLWRVPADGSAPPEQLTRPEPGESHRWPSALPGGRAVVFNVRRGPRMESNDVGVLDLDTGEWKVLVRSGLAPKYAASGHLIFGREGALFAVAFDLRGLRTSGAPVPVIEGVAMESVLGVAAYDLSQRGHLFYLPARWRTAYRNRLVTVDPYGNRSATACPEGAIWSAWASPDGAAALLERDDLPPTELWTCSLASGTQQQLTQGHRGITPVWTRKGVYFGSHANGAANLWFISARGGSTATQVRVSEANQWPCAAGGGGSQLLYQELDPETGWDLWSVDLEGGDPTLLLGTPAREASCALDTDETWLAFESEAEGSIQVYVTPYPGVEERINVSQGPGIEPRWSRDGSELYFLRGDQLWAVSRPATDADWPAPRPLFTLNFASEEYDTLPDGRFLAVERVDWDDTVDVVVVENWFEELKRLVPVD